LGLSRANDYLAIPPEELGRGTNVRVTLVETNDDLDRHFAHAMLTCLQTNQTAGRPTALIVPVGPVGQYRHFASLCNQARASCRNLILIGMDEYMLDDRTLVPEDHPLSFRAFVHRELVQALHVELRPPAGQIVFPDPQDLAKIDRVIERYGGVDVAFGGVGINGHIAFNEPEPNLSTEAFARLGTRVISLRWETRVVNSITAATGAIEAIPATAVTIGPRQILGAKRIRFYLNREWQPAVIRKLLYGPVGPQFPASLLRMHPDVELVASTAASRLPRIGLR
jgi:glucosamine-6-phosphate deaminase